MPNPVEMVLKKTFGSVCKSFISAFPNSYENFKLKSGNSGSNSAYQAAFDAYSSLIEKNSDKIYRAAAFDISEYLYLYKVQPNQTIDEYKAVYFLGRVIERFLIRDATLELAQIHSYSMIHLLDFRLISLGVKRPLLTKAMLTLIDQREFNNKKFDEQMGVVGCYLVYKCLGNFAKENPP